MVPRKNTKQKKPSKVLQNKVAAYNRFNEATNKKLAAMRADIYARCKKEGIAVR